MGETVEVRCPSDLRRLFFKLQVSGERPRYTQENWVEITCPDCRKEYQRSGRRVRRVLHRFSFVGVLMETVLILVDGTEENV